MRWLAVAVVTLLCVSTLPTSSAGGDGVHWNGYDLDRAPIPNRVLIDQDGNNYSLQKGSADVMVVAFIFTTCVDVCPVITSNLKSAESQLGDVDYQFISITVDPATDTPEVLKEYVDDFGATWPHLTGDISDMEEVWDDFQISVDTTEIETHDHEHDDEEHDMSHDDDTATVTLVMPDGNNSQYDVEPTGWDQLTAAAYQNNWTINANESQWGHFITGINGDDSPSDYSWWWELHSWNQSTSSWEGSSLGIDSIDAGQLAFAPNSTNDSMIPTPDVGNDSFMVVQLDGTDDTSILTQINAWHMSLAALDTFDAPSSQLGHYMSSINNVSGPEDYSWWWQLHYWNMTSESWEESMLGMDSLIDQMHIAWAPNSTMDSMIPAPPESEQMIHKLGVVYPGGETDMFAGTYSNMEMVSAIEHTIHTLGQNKINHVITEDYLTSINDIDTDYNLYIWHDMGEYSHWMTTSDASTDTYLMDDSNHYAWVADGEDASTLMSPLVDETEENQVTTSTSHSTQTFILDDDWNPIVVFLGYDWNVDDFVDDVKRAANTANNPGDEDSGLPGFTFATVAASLGLAIIASRRQE
ncbi:SCO family protein [Candidatus Poseidoniaceae archaeon]|nr:SCO family protein [Candidatus Poseidoniaceae archaeon]